MRVVPPSKANEPSREGPTFGGAIEDSARLARALINETSDSIFLLDETGAVLELNTAASIAFSGGATGLQIGPPATLFNNGPSAQDFRSAVVAAVNGGTSRLRSRVPRADGSDRWWDVTLTPVAEGRRTRILCTCRDITPLVHREMNAAAAHLRAEQASSQSETLRAEAEARFKTLQHLTRNTFSSYAGLIRIQQRNANAAASSALLNASLRFAVLTILHDLAETNRSASALGTYPVHRLIQAVCNEFEDTLGLQDLSIDARLAEAKIPVHDCPAIAMILCELLINAASHGRGADGVQITVSLSHELGGTLRLSVGDRGEGPPGRDMSQGTGAAIIDGYSDTLGGRFVLAQRKGGGASAEFVFNTGARSKSA